MSDNKVKVFVQISDYRLVTRKSGKRAGDKIVRFTVNFGVQLAGKTLEESPMIMCTGCTAHLTATGQISWEFSRNFYMGRGYPVNHCSGWLQRKITETLMNTQAVYVLLQQTNPGWIVETMEMEPEPEEAEPWTR